MHRVQSGDHFLRSPEASLLKFRSRRFRWGWICFRQLSRVASLRRFCMPIYFCFYLSTELRERIWRHHSQYWDNRCARRRVMTKAPSNSSSLSIGTVTMDRAPPSLTAGLGPPSAAASPVWLSCFVRIIEMGASFRQKQRCRRYELADRLTGNSPNGNQNYAFHLITRSVHHQFRDATPRPSPRRRLSLAGAGRRDFQ